MGSVDSGMEGLPTQLLFALYGAPVRLGGEYKDDMMCKV